MYHVFTNNCDEWVETKKEAIRIFKQFVTDERCARLYVEEYEKVEDDEPIREDCLKSFGAYPL